ncbi:hypothetical protein OG585_19065 [Streptomyces sp. NBC_01340]|uniref:hypothetical protein n=1 Tax=unclassified Streptomyces TaxID=2593676 RepID=UPI002254D706|nr:MULTISPECIES: hypothetical protein [unclassified Streptomyces]MCX4454761.1 hypothetical protein [Streptomyces sp. NBC_01719]MCX4494121.1 hypothetical protein [Streptomyces sp. NBC_01728]WSI39184.1 hypothetical protein OG585_19065 [Streptomyces sp. NBC_01340]
MTSWASCSRTRSSPRRSGRGGGRVGRRANWLRRLQEIVIEAARDVRDFYDQRAGRVGEPAAAAGAQGRHLLVLSIDATGDGP